jgi:Transposase DDE domain
MAALHRPKKDQGVGLTRKDKGIKWMVLTDGNSFPLAVLLDSAQKAEIQLAEKTLNLVWVPKNGPGRPKTRPRELVADLGYDSQAFHTHLRRRGTSLHSRAKWEEAPPRQEARHLQLSTALDRREDPDLHLDLAQETFAIACRADQFSVYRPQ